MANITISVQSLLNNSVYNSYTVDNASTVASFKTTIASARGYASTNWFTLYFNNQLLADANTLASYSIVTGSQLKISNEIAYFATKELKQKAKLDLAKLDRTAQSNPRSNYDITKLPTQYSGNNLVDNPNSGGLIKGRPWI